MVQIFENKKAGCEPLRGMTLEKILPNDGVPSPQESLSLASMTDLYFATERAVKECAAGNGAGTTAKMMIYEEMSRRESEMLCMIGALAERDLGTESIDDLFKEYRRCYRLSWDDNKAAREEIFRLSAEVTGRIDRLQVLSRAIRNRIFAMHEDDKGSQDDC
jgi:hypothetical protein